MTLLKLTSPPVAGKPFTVPSDARIYEQADAITRLAAIDDPLPIMVDVRGIVSFGSLVPPARVMRITRIGNRERHAGFTVHAPLTTLYAKEA